MVKKQKTVLQLILGQPTVGLNNDKPQDTGIHYRICVTPLHFTLSLFAFLEAFLEATIAVPGGRALITCPSSYSHAASGGHGARLLGCRCLCMSRDPYWRPPSRSDDQLFEGLPMDPSELQLTVSSPSSYWSLQI
jgi:hypothetical protein